MSEDHSEMAIKILHGISLMLWLILVIIVYFIEKKLIILILGSIFGLIMSLMLFSCSCHEDDREFLQHGIPIMSVIIGTCLMGQSSESYSGNYGVFSWLIFIGLLTIFLTVPDIYFGHDYMKLTRHVKLTLRNFSIATFSLALLLFFINKKISKNIKLDGKLGVH